MPQVKQTVSQMSLQIRQGSLRDILLARELHGEAAEASRLHKPGSVSELPDLGVLPGCIWGQKNELCITPHIFCHYLHFAFRQMKEMWVPELKAVTYPGSGALTG